MRRCVVAVLALLALAAPASATELPGRYIVILKASAGDPATVAAQHARSYGVHRSAVYRHVLAGYAASIPASMLAAVRDDGRVDTVVPDTEFSLTAASSPRCGDAFGGAAFQCIPRGVDRIEGDLSSTVSGNGRGAIDANVAVIDSGVTAVPDLNVAGGVDCVAADKGNFTDRDGHGTHVAGIIGALDNARGVVGVAPGARIWAARVANNTAITLGAELCALDWATSTRSDADASNDIAVVNMSLGGPGDDDGNCGLSNKDVLHQAICRVVGAGIVVVASAGNDTRDIMNVVPAAYDEVLTVTAMSDWDAVPGGVGGVTCEGIADDVAAPFSNFASLPADRGHVVAAPGVCIPSTYPPGPGEPERYFRISGTSMAAPHIAGTVALCIASGPCVNLTPQQIVAKVVADARAFSESRKGLDYGFQGDPRRPDPARYYGYLVNASLY
jgi:subtilisin